MTDGSEQQSAGEAISAAAARRRPVIAKLARRKSVWLLFAAAAAGGWYYYQYPYQNAQALAEAQRLCEAERGFRVTDMPSWQEVLSVSPDPARPGKYRGTLELGPIRLEPLGGTGRAWIKIADVTYSERVVARMESPTVFPAHPLSGLGLTPGFASFDCFMETPSTARSILLGW